jgi:hypothetical protein
MTHKNRKKLRNFKFRSDGCSLFRAEGFSRSLDVLYEGKNSKKNLDSYCFVTFL